MITTNAPVGPPIWTGEPLNSAINAPPMIAENNPCSGVAPDAMANATESGKAMIVTLTAARKSRPKSIREYPLNKPQIRGREGRIKCMGVMGQGAGLDRATPNVRPAAS